MTNAVPGVASAVLKFIYIKVQKQMCQEHLDPMLKSTMKYSTYAIQNAHKIKWENIVKSYVTESQHVILYLEVYSKYLLLSISKHYIESNLHYSSQPMTQ